MTMQNYKLCGRLIPFNISRLFLCHGETFLVESEATKLISGDLSSDAEDIDIEN